ncbi:MAG: LON peptidase substrate-binding domain-containing protein [Acidobacteriaceae bacterium]|nr:LON peptidase substrate-binding domain-containing protein [Acidobacteriaceae bacterium]
MGEQFLPLFPLSVVLLPATPLPLHIFEDRYKEMMGELIPSRAEFGVVMAKDDGIVNVGCSATVDRVLQRYPDGRLDLIAIGQRRFRVVSLNDDKAYLRAAVEYFNDDEATEVPTDLRRRAIAGFERLRKIEEPNVVIEPSLEAPQLSFQLTQFISDLDKRQTVLSLRSETERLEFLVGILPAYILQRERITLAKRVAPLNGHVKHISTSRAEAD